MTRTRVSFTTVVGRLQRFHYTRKGAFGVIARASWNWAPGDRERAEALVDPHMLERFEDSVTRLVRNSVVYCRAAWERPGDEDAVRTERTGLKAAAAHFDSAMADLGVADRDRMEKKYRATSVRKACDGSEGH